MEKANTEESFVLGCHEMRNTVYEIWKPSTTTTVVAVRATPVLTAMCRMSGAEDIRKIKASKELYAKVFKPIDTLQKPQLIA